MATKIATIELDPATCEFSVDLTGFKGKGCSLIAAEFAKGGKVLRDIKKPEFKTTTTQQICQ